MDLTAAARLTEEQVELMTGPQLVAAHNALATVCNVNAVAKFKDRATGIKRVMQMIPVAAKIVATSTKAAKKTVERKQRAESLSAKIRALILEGKTNREIQTILNLDSDKNHYPTWYRGEMRRKGIAVPTPQAAA